VSPHHKEDIARNKHIVKEIIEELILYGHQNIAIFKLLIITCFDTNLPVFINWHINKQFERLLQVLLEESGVLGENHRPVASH
jgi:hypothetical protein